MRYVPTYCIRENTILAKPILSANGEVLLHQGVQLKKSYLRKLLTLGVPGVYISDTLSEDLEIANVLSDEVRLKVANGVKNAFMSVTKQKTPHEKSAKAEKIHALAENIVEEILSNDNIMLNLIDIKVYNDYTFFHCLQVAIISVTLGIGIGYRRSMLVDLASAALTHDIGKTFIPREIINKESALTQEEFNEIKNHVSKGYEYLRDHYKMKEIAAYGVLDHHERYDGNGYPNGKKGKKISEFGRIIAVADVYDALISDRPYRKGIFAAEAMEHLMGGSGTMFDPDIISIMTRKMALFPLGSCVLLSNGATGLVIENYEDFGQRPKLKIFLQDDMPIEPYILDLCSDYSTFNITVVATVICDSV